MSFAFPVLPHLTDPEPVVLDLVWLIDPSENLIKTTGSLLVRMS